MVSRRSKKTAQKKKCGVGTQNHIFKSIRARLIFTFLAVGLFSVILIGAYSYHNIKADLNDAIQDGLLLLAESKEGEVFAYLDAIEARTIDFSSDGFIRDATKEITQTGSQEAIAKLNRHLVVNKKSLDPIITGIMIMNLEGKVIAATDHREIGKDESQDVYFQKGKESIFTMELSADTHFGSDKENSLIVVAPLIDKENPALRIGVITIVFSNEKLQDIISGKFQMQKGTLNALQNMKKTLEMYLIDKNKHMVIHPVSDLSTKITHTPDMIVNTLPVQHCLKQHKEISGTYKTYHGAEVVGASICLPQREWTLVVEITTKEAFAPIRKNVFRYVILVLLFSALIIVTAWKLGESISKPIIILNDAAQQIEKGNLTTKVSINTGDELQNLGMSFNKTTEALKKKDQAQNYFFSVASHQLKTPLTPINIQLERLKSGKVPQKQLEKVHHIILVNFRRLHLQINDLLDLSRIRAKHVALSKKKMDIVDLLKEVILSVQDQAQKQDIIIQTSFAKVPLIYADYDRIRDVIINLFDNALKYAKRRIEVKLIAAQGKVLIYVADDGPGIPKKWHKEVFTPFFRAGEKGTTEGTGLGLAICEGLVKQHGGSIAVKTNTRGGATFYFTLPSPKTK